MNEFTTAGRGDYIALDLYPETLLALNKVDGETEDLRRAFESGRLESSGLHVENPNQRQKIPSEEWVDLTVWPPHAFVVEQLGSRRERWRAIRVESADMKRLWRSVNEVSGRSKFDWLAIKIIFDEVCANNPSMSKNERIEELQFIYEERFKKAAPGRSTIQRKIKDWT